MRRNPTREFAFEVERGNATVEFVCRYTVSPGEPPHGPTYDCGGYPGSDPEVESKEVFFVRIDPCADHRFKYQGRQTCIACKRICEPRPELEDLVDDSELLEAAAESAADDYWDEMESRAEARRDAREDR